MNKKNIIAVIVIIILLAGGIVYRNNQDSVYVDKEAKFSVILPKGWTVVDKEVSTTSSNTWFKNINAEGENKTVSIVIGKHTRTENMNRVISIMDINGFLNGIVENMKKEINMYAMGTTTKVMINDVQYNYTPSTYEGVTSKKQVTQYLYLTLTEDDYYLIGADIYTELLPNNKDEVLKIINSIRLL